MMHIARLVWGLALTSVLVVGCSSSSEGSPGPSVGGGGGAAGVSGGAGKGGSAVKDIGWAFEPCALPALPLDANVNSLALSPDGSKLYLTLEKKDEKGGELHRYDVASAGACALTLDASFGSAGKMTLTAPSSDLEVRADEHGNVYVNQGPARVVPGATVACDMNTSPLSQRMATTPENGALLAMNVFDKKISRYSFDGSTCTHKDEPLEGMDGWQTDAIAVHQGLLLVGGSYGLAGLHQVRVFDATTLAPLLTYGNQESIFVPGSFCWATALFACGNDVCVMDGNCQKFSRFSVKGELLGTIEDVGDALSFQGRLSMEAVTTRGPAGYLITRQGEWEGEGGQAQVLYRFRVD